MGTVDSLSTKDSCGYGPRNAHLFSEEGRTIHTSTELRPVLYKKWILFGEKRQYTFSERCCGQRMLLFKKFTKSFCDACKKIFNSYSFPIAICQCCGHQCSTGD